MECKDGFTWDVLQLEHWTSGLHSHFSLSTVKALTILNKQGFNRKVKECLPNIHIHTHMNMHVHVHEHYFI